MIITKIRTVAVCFLAFSSMSASAALIDHGDFFTDTDSGLDWLDVTATTNVSYDVISQRLGAGDEFDGYRFATEAEFRALTQFPFPATFNEVTEVANHSIVDDLVTLLGSTIDVASLASFGQTVDDRNGHPEGEYFDATYGFLLASPSGAHTLAVLSDDDRDVAFPDSVQLWTSMLDATESAADVGSYLVRASTPPNDVPEPSTLVLLGLGIAGLGFVRKQKTS